MLSTKNYLTAHAESRLDYLDIFRSFGIILMVMGHIGYGRKFDLFIHAFNMPMFFWISGFLFAYKPKRNLSFRIILTKKTKSLLLPYAVFGIVHYLAYAANYYIAYSALDISPLIHLFLVNTDGLPISGALWFLTALFFADILFFLIDRYIANGILKILIISIISFTGIYAKTLFPITLPFALGPSFVGVGLYYIGYLFKTHADTKIVSCVMNLKWSTTLIWGIITSYLIFKNGYINMRTETYSCVPMFWINALISIVVGVNLSKLLYKVIHNHLVGNWLTDIGKNSIIYVCINQAVILVVGTVIKQIALPDHISAMLILPITLAILYTISKIFTKTKLRFIIGR